jgi:hypothetical protein
MNEKKVMAIFPREDGDFELALDDGTTMTSPRQRTLEVFPELSDAHDEEFGEGKWGKKVP